MLLNCEKGPTDHPCGVCASCIEVSAGGSVDVIEIDAASNRGINEMRELRENVRYQPARDRFGSDEASGVAGGAVDQEHSAITGRPLCPVTLRERRCQAMR